MNKSETIGDLLKSMSEFQGELENVEKAKEGHGYKYATLGACIDAAKPILKKFGLSVIQLMGDDGNGNSTMETVLGHSSGEYISTSCIIPIAKLAGGGANNPAQVMGASVTYIRRYQFAAIIGLAQDDDDAVSATSGKAQYKNKSKDNEDPVNWYQDSQFQKEKEAITKAIRDGMPPTEVINNIQGQGFTINKKIKEEIKAI